MDGRRRGIYDTECCTDGLEGKNWTDGREECRQGTERDELHLNFTSIRKLDCRSGVVLGSNLLHLALLPLSFQEVLNILLRVRYSVDGKNEI